MTFFCYLKLFIVIFLYLSNAYNNNNYFELLTVTTKIQIKYTINITTMLKLNRLLITLTST